jgi:uncharacterized protein (TIGR00730 family)
MMKSVCVFCGSNPGNDVRFQEAARRLGALFALEGITLVYGGGSVGLMGVIADAVLEGGGEAVGVIPNALWKREVGHKGLSQIHIVETMHERKAMMAGLSDGFIALPGGLGTLEEIFEIWTWSQLGMHRKPIGFLDVAGFYEPLFNFLDSAVSAGFVRPQHRGAAMIDDEPERLLQRMREYQAPVVQKWIGRDET